MGDSQSLRNGAKNDILSLGYTPVPGYWERAPLVREIDEIARGSFMRKDPPDVQGSGYVVRSLEAALWSFYNTDNCKAHFLAWI